MPASKSIRASVAGAPIILVPLDHLHLDPDNPRLPTGAKRGDKDIMNFIAENTAVDDLVNAIGTNDFFPGEPLVAVPHPNRSQHFIVVEGNRRLTALRLLQDPDEIDAPSSRLKNIVALAQYKHTNIPVVVRANREEVLPYLGFRHITGVTAWEPLAKARYMKQLFDLLTKRTDKPENRYLEVAQAIGTRITNVRRNLDALAVYRLMEREGFFGVPDLSEDTIKFGVLYTAISDEAIAAFVGAAKRKSPKANSDYVSTNPIVNPSCLKKVPIRDLTRWLFLKKDGATIVGESRNLKFLSRIVSDADALKALRNGSSLDFAHRLTSGSSEDFLVLLYRAEVTLKEAASLVATLSFNPDALKLATQLADYVALITQAIQSKQRPRAKS